MSADTKALEDLAADLVKMKRQVLGRLTERGYQLLRDEVPVDQGNLKQGVASPDVDYQKMEAVLTVTAESARVGSREARVIGADGKEKKTVTLRPRPAYNYALVVAKGYKPRIRPKNAKALLIPVPTAPTKGGYLIAGGQIYVVRKSTKGIKANPYDERAAKRLEGEAEKIANAVLAKFI